jgi:hypothetical protein
VDALSASDADKRHEEFLKWKSEQQKLAKQKKKEVDIEVLESPIKNKQDEAERNACTDSSSPSPASSPSKLSSPTSTPETFSQGVCLVFLLRFIYLYSIFLTQFFYFFFLLFFFSSFSFPLFTATNGRPKRNST